MALFTLLFLIPIYPTLASFVYNNHYDFSRNDIDESSILGAYYSDSDEDKGSIPMLESSDSFLSVKTILKNDERDLS
jgi:hypothetical protein